MGVSSRRNLLAVTAAAGGLLAAAKAQADTPALAGPHGHLGPQDPREAAISPLAFDPTSTDHGNLGTLKYSFSSAHNRATKAGWAREVTVRNFPMSKAMAGVNMRLDAGGVRELHWHTPSEWAYMLAGTARITAVDPTGKKFVADVAEGDLWFFPSGIPHSIQGLGPDGCEFLLAFNDGNFSEDSTFLITDWVNHTPKEVLAKNMGWPASAFDKVPPKELYIFNAPHPGALKDDLAESKNAEVPQSYAFSLLDVEPIKTRGGTVRIADMNNFKASNVMSAALVEVEPGGLRELHWHLASDEWQYYISGTGRMTIFAGEGRANTVEFAPSDVGYVPRTMGHYIENTGPDTLRFLEIFAVGQYSDISLNSWIANTPHALVAAHLGIEENLLSQMPQNKTPVVPA
jgi:oxalate decarboxylase